MLADILMQQVHRPEAQTFALFCHNSQAQSKFTAVNLIYSWHTQLFLVFIYDKQRILLRLKRLLNITNKIECLQDLGISNTRL